MIAAAAIPYFNRGLLPGLAIPVIGLPCNRFKSARSSAADAIPPRTILLQKLADDALQLGRDLWIALLHRLRRLIQ